MAYIKLTQDEIQRAGNIEIAELLKAQGESVKKEGKAYSWLDGTQKVSICGNLWFHQYERVGGNSIDFVRKFYNKSFYEAVQYLLEGNAGETIYTKPKEKPKPFILPQKNKTMNRVYAYLMYQRGIDKDVISSFAKKGMLYESDKYHNAVFVGYDKDGIPKHAHQRSTISNSNFKNNPESSLDEYAFHWNGTNDKIYLFEAPIDMMSYICMHKNNWQENTYASACSVSDKVLFQCLNDNPNLSKVYLCFDNDDAGRKAVNRITDKLSQLNIETEILVPTYKDWNEDLINLYGDDEQCKLEISQDL
jgi:hypothetical protein